MADEEPDFLKDAVEEEVEDQDVEEGETVEVDSRGDEVIDVATPADNNSLIEPAAGAGELALHFEKYKKVRDKIIDEDEDVQVIGNQSFIMKSGMRKLATAFNLSIDTIYEQRYVEDGILKYKVKAKAVAPNGRTSTGLGVAGSNESNFMVTRAKNKSNEEHARNNANRPENLMLIDGKWRELLPPSEVDEHSILATAATRAKNRAISDLIGGGEVSSEEVTGGPTSKEEIFD